MPQVPIACAVVTQVVPLQQPPLQEPALQTHWPLLQAWPLAQPTQAAPPVPQLVVPDVWHWPFLSQQPFGQELASADALPLGAARLLVAAGRAGAAAAPHVVFDAVTHEPFEQQPAQLEPPQLQAPPLHACPEAQTPHAAPFEPQALVLCADVATHFPVPSQQPPGQDEGVQAQTPVAPQVWPLGQAAQVAPLGPQLVID